MTVKLSVIICTYNPKWDYLIRVLAALRNQSLLYNEWELLLIDNASDTRLADELDLSWHPNSRIIREDKLGLTVARLRGIREANGETLVFVDDDNVLDNSYLAIALEISTSCKWSIIGAWGGQTIGEFEVIPPEWTKNFLHWLNVREFKKDIWASSPEALGILPWGAGMCIRRVVAQTYVENISNNQKRIELDRKGKNQLTSTGDIDMALTACDLGFGTAIFAKLILTHLIPSFRLEESYLLRLVESGTYSGKILSSVRNHIIEKPSLKSQIIHHLRRLKLDSRSRRFYDAENRGKQRAIKELLQMQRNGEL